jgi:urea transport system substrate-binding protein
MISQWIQVVILVTLLTTCSSHSEKPVKVGVLHSLTGSDALGEQRLIHALTLAVEEVNAKGGLLGRQLEMVMADGASEPLQFAAEAVRLIEEEKVLAVFGGRTSASRKAVKAVVEKHRHLLFYPVQYEGLALSANIV